MSSSDPTHPRRWTFLSNHGHVLVLLARHPDATTREIAAEAGITERSVQLVIADLVECGYVIRSRTGRRNHYEMAPDTHLRHPAEARTRVDDLLSLFVGPPIAPPVPAPPS